MITVAAPAKLNVFLSVGPRRGDGFHEIETIYQSISLYDEITLAASAELRFDVTPPGSAPEDETNLVVRATRALWAALGRTPGATIHLSKAIPSQAGLGGASADAAGTLIGLNALWEARLSRKSLERLGAALGSDVPFCVRGATAAARGRGEILSPLPCLAELWWVVAVPAVALSTASVYAAFDSITPAPSVRNPFEIADALAKGSVEAIASLLSNDLEPAALSLAPVLSDTRDALIKAGALGVVLCGSGSAWAGLCASETHARAVASSSAAAATPAAMFTPFVAHSVDSGPRIVASGT